MTTFGKRISDQRAAGFNYGAGNPAAVRMQIYKDCEAVAAVLREAVIIASDRSWRIDMLLRNARLAETDEERFNAGIALSYWLATPSNNPTGGDPTPNYSFDQLAALGAGMSAKHAGESFYDQLVRLATANNLENASVSDKAMIERTKLRRATVEPSCERDLVDGAPCEPYTGQPSPGVAVMLPPLKADKDDYPGPGMYDYETD